MAALVPRHRPHKRHTNYCDGANAITYCAQTSQMYRHTPRTSVTASRAGRSRGSGGCSSGRSRLAVVMIERFIVHWWYAAIYAVETTVVPPIRPLSRGEFEVIESATVHCREWARVHWGVDRLGERVVVAVARSANRGDRTDLRQPSGVVNGEVVTEFKGSLQHLARRCDAPTQAKAVRPRASSSNSFTRSSAGGTSRGSAALLGGHRQRLDE
jgi:hypothetical protein